MNILVIGKEGRLQQHSQKGRLDGHSLTYLPLDASPEVMIEKGRMAEVILIDAMGSLPGPVIECLPRLKLIHSEGVGYQGIDTETARRMGIYVCNCRGINAMAVAEHAVMLMVACLRDLAVNHQKVLEGLQIETKEGYMRTGSIREMSDCTVGLVGFGAIAREAARLLEVYGARCLFFDLSEVDKDLTHGAEQVDLDTLLSSSDIVSLHLPVTESTRNFADEAFFKKLKAGTIFINTARGELVDTKALLSALSEGQVAMAGLDCIAGEPVRPDNPLLQADPALLSRTILSPHIAGITGGTFRRGYEIFWKNVARIEKGECPDNIVNGLWG